MNELTILVVGGYGVFGGRIVSLLEDEPRLKLIVAGRSPTKARQWVEGRSGARARLMPAVFDRTQLADAQFAALKPDLVIDASGPFQDYGDGRYDLVKACIRLKIPYLDLADGSEFVDGVGAFDAAAREAGVFVLSGVSSFPVLTAAVVRRLSRDMDSVDEIRAGIAPSPFAGVGDNVIRAIASYAGQPVKRKRDGKVETGYPFTEHMRYTIAPSGYEPLRDTLFSLVDVPDLIALARLWPQAKTVWMGAGPVPEILHRALIAFSWPVRWRIVPTIAPLAPLMAWVINHVRWGEHRGGMFVEVKGRQGGASKTRSWHLLAEGDDGPLIPAMAVEAIVRRMLSGKPPASGARACVTDLELDDYEKLIARRTIYAGERGDEPDAPLYRQMLGTAWDRLPPTIRQLHDLDDAPRAWEGRARVERGPSAVARAVASLFGFPPASADTPVRVDFTVEGGVETWTRNFGGKRFKSSQSAGEGRWNRLLVERFGPLRFAMAVTEEGGKLGLRLRGWRLLGLPLPLWMAPFSDSYEFEQDGRFHFHVDIAHWLTGTIVTYQGWLAPVQEAQRPDQEKIAAE